MTKSNRFLYSLVGLLLFTGSIYAQTITVGTASGAPGEEVTVQLDWDPNSNSYRTLQFTVNFDLVALPAVDTTDCPIEPYITGYIQSSCDQQLAPADNEVLLGLLNFTGSIPQGNLGQLKYTIAANATPGTVVPLTLSGVVIEGNPDPIINNGSVTVTEPQPGVPAYSSNPASAVVLGPVVQGGTDPMQPVVISNVGESGSTLTGSCTETSDPSGVFSITSGSFSVAQGGSENVMVACDSAGAVTTHSGGMQCTHNGGAGGAPSPVNYTLSCTITQPPVAVPMYSSNPASGPFAMSGAEDSPITPVTLAISNTGEQGSILTGTCGFLPGGDSQISVSDGAFSVPQGGAPDVQTISCDSADAGDYSATLSCAHNGSNASPVTYGVTCSVNAEPKSDVVTTPGDGATIPRGTDVGGTETFTVTFEEDADLGIDASLTACSLADETNFAITAPTVYPVTIPAGGSVVVMVDGTNPGTAETVSDTLNCTYTDTANPSGANVSYQLVLSVGGDARFEVTKDFTDDSIGDIEVTITCTTGLPLTQTATLSDGEDVVFVVTDFIAGDMNCSISEDGESGYVGSYSASGDSQNDDDSLGCHFTAINGGDYNYCDIDNDPAPVAVTINKVWAVFNTGGDAISEDYILTLHCDSRIVGGTEVNDNGYDSWMKTYSGSGNGQFTAMVVPNYPYSSCSVKESGMDSTVDVQNGCGNITVSVNNPDSCTITNTVFFEGIPTLSQWGLAIMALLMLGVGMVGFRRFV